MIDRAEYQEAAEQEATEESGLNKEITVKFLLRFAMPTILSYLLQYTFSIVDAVFASRGISVEALSAVNIVIPYITLVLGIGTMFAMGGCALVAKKKGEKLYNEARQNFTLVALTRKLTSLNSTVPLKFCGNGTGSSLKTMLPSVSSTSFILLALTTARGTIMNIMEIIRNEKIISIPYCKKAKISPMSARNALACCAPTQTMAAVVMFIIKEMIGVIKAKV